MAQDHHMAMAQDHHMAMDEKYENVHRQLNILVDAHLPLLVAKVVATRDGEKAQKWRQETQRRSCESLLLSLMQKMIDS